MFKIMVIEDDELIREELSFLLSKNNYKVFKVTEFSDIEIQVKENLPDLILLDINLPKEDGFSILTKIKTFLDIPVIFVTSKNTSVDEIMGITLGADDFITKPYNTNVLLARISSVLKRVYPNKQEASIIIHNDLKLDLANNKVSNKDKSIELTKTEFKILYFLIKNKSKILSRVEILEYLWDNTMFVNDNTLTVNITRIRAKLESIHMNDYIKTKRGQGYLV